MSFPSYPLKRFAQKLFDPLILKLVERANFLTAPKEDLRAKQALAEVSESAVLHPTATLSNLSRTVAAIKIGDRTHIRGQLQTDWQGGAITIGNDCYIGDGSRVWSHTGIVIGNNVLISHLVDIHDSDSHPINSAHRRTDARAILAGTFHSPSETLAERVQIDDDVWICCKATVLKGVHIGRGAIIAANTVVTRDVPKFCIVAGNPARVVREIPEDGET